MAGDWRGKQVIMAGRPKCRVRVHVPALPDSAPRTPGRQPLMVPAGDTTPQRTSGEVLQAESGGAFQASPKHPHPLQEE